MFDLHSPVIPVSGNFFPVWLFAALAGAGLSAALFQILAATGVIARLPLRGLVFLALALLIAVLIYVGWIGGYA